MNNRAGIRSDFSKAFKMLLLTWFMLGNYSHVIGQQPAIDSLLRLNGEQTTLNDNKLQILNSLAERYTWVQIDSAVIFCDRAITLATTLGNKQALVTAYNIKAYCLNQLALPGEAEKLLKLIFSVCESTGDLNGKAEAYLNQSYIRKGIEKENLIKKGIALFKQNGNETGQGKGWAYLAAHLVFQDPDSALKCNLHAIEFLQTASNYKWKVFTQAGLCYCYLITGKLNESLSLANEILEAGILTGDIINTSNGYINIGNYYYMKSDWPKAINNYLNALKLAEQMNSVWLQSAILNNIGGIYHSLKNYGKAIYYFRLGREASVGVPENMVFVLSNIGDSFLQTNQYDSAKVNLEQAISVALSSNNQVRLPSCYINLSEFEIRVKDYENAFLNLNKFLQCQNQEQVLLNKYYFHYIMALLLKNSPDSLLIKNNIKPENRNALALQNLVSSYEFIKTQNLEYETKDILLELSKTYEAKGNTANAYFHFKEYATALDSIDKINNINAIANLQLKYDSEKQDQQIASLQKDKLIHRNEIQKQKIHRNALIGGCSLVLILASFMVNGYFTKIKANRKIEKTVAHLKASQQQLVQQGKLAALGKMTSDVAIRIKEPISIIKSLSPIGLQLVLDYEEANTEKERTTILEKLTNYLTDIHDKGLLANEVVRDVLMQSRKQNL